MTNDWDFRVSVYDGDQLIYETVHKGVSSMEMEIETRKENPAKWTRLVIVDLRLAWRRQLQPMPWAPDLSHVYSR